MNVRLGLRMRQNNNRPSCKGLKRQHVWELKRSRVVCQVIVSFLQEHVTRTSTQELSEDVIPMKKNKGKRQRIM